MKKTIFILLLFFCSNVLFAENKQAGLTQFKLGNGLTVYLWEDKNQPDVTGSVVVRAGSIDEPKEYTGLAHYLEHMLFKGTQRIGSLDWLSEKPHYDNIIKLYDEFAVATDPIVRDTLAKKINRESIAEAQYSQTNDFSNLVEGLGGEGLNAGTSYDVTEFHNNFPSFQLDKWLDLYSERLINPVFRSFQAELENVFEEYNMYQDNNDTHVSDFLFSNLYKGHPYSRDVIGLPEHLKNPRLSKLIEFYNTWYVPENMALVLVGNFDSQTAIPLIKAKFSRLKAAKVSERVIYPETDFKGNLKFSAKIANYPQVFWGYKGVKKGNPDELLLDFCVNLLSNKMKTGLLDKLNLNGDVQYATAEQDSRRDQGRLLIFSIPYYDVNQKMYDSDKATEKIIMAEVDKLKSGDIQDWLFQSVKDNLLRQQELILETPSQKASLLKELFAYQLPLDYFATETERLKSITKEDVQRVAKQYLSADHVTVSFEEGTPKKNKLKKPDIKPIDQPKGKMSEYAKMLQAIPVTPVKEEYNNFGDVKTEKLYDGITLNCTENKVNDYFTLTIKYGVGTKKMPKLAYATNLMNSAGIMPNSDAQSVRREFSELNARCVYSVTDDYFYISLLGDEKNLAKICQLMTRQTLMPKLDEKQLNRVKGGEYTSRMLEKKDVQSLGSALLQYALYKDSSDYVNRLKFSKVYSSQISELTGEIVRATNYEASIHYVGKKPIEEVSQILKANLPLKEGVKKSESPLVAKTVVYEKPTIYFLPNADAQQSKIYFYIDGPQYKIEDDVNYKAFYQYFSGGFSGLVMQEIRENNSMAYTAYGAMVTPPVQNKKSYFIGYVGTQPDKAADAIDLYVKLLKDMPLRPDRIANIKTYLRQSVLTDKPSFRSKSQMYEGWKQLGYTDDPAKVDMAKIDNLTFDQIVNFYQQNIKGKPVTIVIMGDPKLVNLKQIQTNQGKVTKLSSSTLFNVED